MADKKISQLTAASQVNSDAVFPLSQLVSGNDETLKATVGQVGDYIADEQTHPGLNTLAKDLIGAINEIVAGGGGASLSTVLSNGVISTDSAYATANFSDISNYKYIFIRIRDTVNGVDYDDFIGLKVSKIVDAQTYNLTMNLHTAIKISITPTSIRSTQYSGNYYYIYADIVATDSEIFS